MSVVELAVKDQENGVWNGVELIDVESILLTRRTVAYEWCDDFSLWPFGLCIELFGVLIPAAFVGDGDLCKVVVQYSLMEVYDEL